MIKQYLAQRDMDQKAQRDLTFKKTLENLGLQKADVEFVEKDNGDSISYWMASKTTKGRIGPIVILFRYLESDIIRILDENNKGIKIV